MKRKDAITHSTITSKKNPETKRLLSNFIWFTLPPPPQCGDAKRIVL
jgi:hypothetical protein